MRADVAAQPDQPSVIELPKRRIEHPAIDADRVGELTDGQRTMRLVKDRVPHGTQRGGRDGAELDHDNHLPDSARAQSLGVRRLDARREPRVAGAGVVAGLVSSVR